MRTSTKLTQAFSILILAVLFGSGAALGQDCEFVLFNVKAGGTTFPAVEEVRDLLQSCYEPGQIDETFEWCQSAPVVGTLQGDWILCGNADWHVDDPFEVGFSGQIWMNPGLIRTDEGILCTIEQSVVSWDIFSTDRFLFVAMEDVNGGTEKYENASGWLALEPVSDRSRGNGEVRGWVCTP